MGMKQKKKKKNLKRSKMADFQKTEFFKIANSQIFFVKLIDAKTIDVAQPIWS
jgi:hypothetical protein